jgi:membrane protein involved in colicin uptake
VQQAAISKKDKNWGFVPQLFQFQRGYHVKKVLVAAALIALSSSFSAFAATTAPAEAKAKVENHAVKKEAEKKAEHKKVEHKKAVHHKSVAHKKAVHHKKMAHKKAAHHKNVAHKKAVHHKKMAEKKTEAKKN